MRGPAALAALALLGACVLAPVQVMRTGPAVAARPPDCRIAFFRVKAPQQPFDEVAVLQYNGVARSLAETQELLRRQACAAGADAVVVTREFTPGYGGMVVSAIRYRDLTVGQRAVLDKPPDLATEPPPPGYQAVVLRSKAPVYPDASLSEPALATLPEGTVLWRVNPEEVPRFTAPFWENKGHPGTVVAEVRIPDGRIGFVAADQLAPAQPPAGAPHETPPPKPDPDGVI